MIGSFNLNRFRPEFNGSIITILTILNGNLTKVSVIPTSVVGDNPSYVAVYGPEMYTCNSVLPGFVAKIY